MCLKITGIMALNPTEACCSGSPEQSVPQWKKELIIRRRALSRTLQVGSRSVKLTCPAVVTNSREPEISAASDDTYQLSSGDVEPVARNRCSSLNQDRQEQDFHPRTSSAGEESTPVGVGNMRLLDLDACSEVTKVLVNGTDVKSKQSEVSGDKSGNNKMKNTKQKPKHDQNNSNFLRTRQKKSLFLKQVTSNNEESRHRHKLNGMCFPSNDEDCLSDSSEELQYGPGIVNKLKTKYMSMTLREQRRNMRPSIMNLRRATSLENMLEGDGDPSEQNVCATEAKLKTGRTTISKHRTGQMNKPICVGLNHNHRAMMHVESRGTDRMKRARSMDTLLKSEVINSKNKSLENSRAILKKEDFRSDRVLVAPFVNENIIIIEQSTLSSQQPKDLQKPEDIHVVPSNKELPPPDVVRQTLKIFETSPIRKVKTKEYNLVKPLGLPKTTSQTSVTGNPIDKQKISVNKPALSPKPSPDKVRQNRNRVNGSPRNCQKNILVSLNCVPDVPSSSSGVFNKNNNYIDRGPLIQEQPTLSTCPDEFDETDSQIKSDSECSKPVLESALENIRKGGISMHFSFRNDEKSSNSSKSHLPRRNVSTPQALNTSLLHQKYPLSPVSIVAPIRSHSSPQTKQVGIIRPLVTTKTEDSHPSAPLLTEQEIEKNLINRVKSIEQPISKVVVAIKGLPDSVMIGTLPSDVISNSDLSMSRVCPSSKTKSQSLWDDKQLWHQNQNTIVFNFSDRKEVPDYIENDGIILKGKGDQPRRRGHHHGDGAGEDAEADEEEAEDERGGACDVTFEGANVLINGKSNLQKSPKQVKLRIKFDDGATTTFEYPSEASLAREEPEGGSVADCTPQQPHAERMPVAAPLGGSLGAYTPRKTDADWQLGAAPPPPSTVPATTCREEEDLHHLKPASPEETHAWSEETASDLLF